MRETVAVSRVMKTHMPSSGGDVRRFHSNRTKKGTPGIFESHFHQVHRSQRSRETLLWPHQVTFLTWVDESEESVCAFQRPYLTVTRMLYHTQRSTVNGYGANANTTEWLPTWYSPAQPCGTSVTGVPFSLELQLSNTAASRRPRQSWSYGVIFTRKDCWVMV